MSSLPAPVWPAVVLAAIQFGDGLLCLKPVRFVEQCFIDVNFPRRFWWVMSPIKIASAAGLIAGIWIPWLGLVTAVCLVLFFVIAISMHIRARDFGRNLFVNATGMFLLSTGTLVFSYLI